MKSGSNTSSVDFLFINVSFLDPLGLGYTPHLGMLYIATYLKESDFSVRYLDLQDDKYNLKKLKDVAREIEPRVIGISVDTDNYYSVINVVKILSEELDDVLIILGGPEASGRDVQLLNSCPCDIVVRGEGEITVHEIAESVILGKGKIEDVNGITYRKNGKIRRNDDRLPIKDLDILPFPDRTLLEEPRKYLVSLITGRGCPYNCTFCYEGLMGNKYRTRSPENILEEIDELIKVYKRTYITICDSIFTAYPNQVEEVCKGIKESFDVYDELVWFCEGRVNVLAKNSHLIGKMVGSGMVRMQIGIESANKDILRAYNKRINLDEVEYVVKCCKESDLLSIYGGFIIGGPFETEETILESIALAKKLIKLAPGRFECNTVFLTPLTKTRIRESPEEFGVELMDPDLKSSHNFNFCTTRTSNLGPDDITNLMNRFKKEIKEEMRSNLSDVPKDLIDSHFDLFRIFGLSTTWHTECANYPRVLLYHEILRSRVVKSYDQISREDLFDFHPYRIPSAFNMDGGLIKLEGGLSDLSLNDLGSRIYRLSSGKLKLKEVIEEIRGELKGRAPPDNIFEEHVLDFYKKLDDNYSCVFKEI
ncbi:MAG: radical SAM protein [Halobacteriota archaeon]|nr:radical SAM protein [Halobacteriota archaeon]